MCATPAAAIGSAAPGLTAIVQDTVRRLPPELRRRSPPGRRSRPARLDSLPADSQLSDSLSAVLENFPEPDSIMRALMGRVGYRTVIYRGDTLQFSNREANIQILNRAHVEEPGQQVFAEDSIIYQRDTGFIVAYGKSRLLNAEGREATSDEGLYYHTGRDVGTLVAGRTRWDVWNVAGNFTLEGRDTLWVRSGHFTSCDLPEPHYRFESDRIKLVMGHIVVAWPVRLYFGDVAVFWFPFMAQDIRRGRHSGILTMRFGINDIVRNSSSHNRHISNLGYYWAISDYMDAQIGLDWWSDTWTRLDGFYRYRWRRQFLNGRLGYSQFFLPDGSRELSLAWNHSQKFGERTDLRASVRFVSRTRFQREQEFNPERLTQQIRSDIGFTRRFDWGQLSLAGQRIQPLTEGGVTTTTLPQASLTLNPIQLTPARSPLEARWFNGLTWTGSTNFSRTQSDRPGQPNQLDLSAGVTSGLTLKNLRLSSNASLSETTIDQPDTLRVDTLVANGDTTLAPVIIGDDVREGRINWRSSLGYQQRLIGSTTLTPAVNLSGTLFRSNETDLNFIAGPTRASLSAALNTDVFGFFPGIGPLERIRHKFSPSFSWSYSPEVQASEEFQRLRGVSSAEAAEQHTLSVGLNQTFEAKLKPMESPGDTAVADSVRRVERQGDRKLTLLAIQTSAVLYDFVEGELTTESVTNTLNSDLLRGLNVRFSHDLFEETPDGERNFDPFLTQMNLSFSIGDRTLGALIGSDRESVRRGRGIVPLAEDLERENEFAEEDYQQEFGGRSERGEDGPSRPWNVSIDYSLIRQRPVPGQEASAPTRQSVNANLGFQPTDNWTLSWRTRYNIEEGEFVDHVLSLRRDLHRWSATFEFLRAANRNFVFEFRVDLNDLPDLKFDWRQETRRN